MSASKEIRVAPGDGEELHVLGVSFTTKASTDQTRGAYFATEAQLGEEGPPLHIHRNDDEAVYVLEGTLEVRSGDETWTAKTGTFTLVPRGTPHTIWSPSGARALLLFSPGETQQFMEEGNGVTDQEEIAAIAEKNGLEVLEG